MPLKSQQTLILSKNNEKYQEIIGQAFPDLIITSCKKLEEARAFCQTSTLLLAEPDLASALINDMSRLEWVQSTWAGVTPLMASDLRQDYLLTGVKDIFGPLISEYTFAYILLFERRILEHRAAQKEALWHPVLPGRLQTKILGILGTGSIAKHLATTAKHFGMQVQGLNTKGQSIPAFDQVFARTELHSFLSRSDYVVNTLPDTPETKYLLDADAFMAFKKGAFLINVGRGSILQENALLEALERNQPKIAVLDVFEQEPLAKDHPFWHHDKIWISSHTAAPSFPEDVAAIFIRNYQCFLEGKPLDYVIDFKKGY